MQATGRSLVAVREEHMTSCRFLITTVIKQGSVIINIVVIIIIIIVIVMLLVLAELKLGFALLLLLPEQKNSTSTAEICCQLNQWMCSIASCNKFDLISPNV
jgi:hypothetical protein